MLHRKGVVRLGSALIASNESTTNYMFSQIRVELKSSFFELGDQSIELPLRKEHAMKPVSWINTHLFF